MKTFFIPNARFFILLLVLIGLLMVTSVALAQEPTETPPVTVIVEQPDVAPAIDRLYDGLDEFMAGNNTQIAMGFIAFAVIAIARIILPNTKLDTERIIQAVVVLFTVLYMLSLIFDFNAGVLTGIDILALLSNSIGALLLMVTTASAAYAVVGRGLKFPLVARSQSDQWGRLGDELELSFVEIEDGFAQITNGDDHEVAQVMG